jgi:hypothetical protein
MAFVVALSVAMLPVAASMAASANTAAMAASGDVSTAMDDCCPDHMNPCDQSSDQCQSMACCAGQSFSISNVTVSPFAFPLMSGDLLPKLTDHAVPLHLGSPPFRPPRV